MSVQKSSGKGAASNRGAGKGKGNSSSPQTRPVGSGRHASRPVQSSAPSKSKGSARDIRNDLIGVALGAFSLALIVVVWAPGEAVVTVWLSSWLHLILGLGAYILPGALIVWAVSFFLEDSFEIHIGRSALGIALIYLSVLSLFSLSVLGAPENPGSLFKPSILIASGGYIGAGIAWVMLTFVGQVVGFILLIAVILGGLILIGFSITHLVTRIVERFRRRAQSSDDLSGEEGARGPYARARIQRLQPIDGDRLRAGKTTVLSDGDAGITRSMSSKSGNRTTWLDEDMSEELRGNTSARISPLVSGDEITASVAGLRNGDLPRRSIAPISSPDVSFGERITTGDDIEQAANALDTLGGQGAETSSRVAKSTPASIAKSMPAVSKKGNVSPESPASSALARVFGEDRFAGFTVPDSSILKTSPAQDTSRAVQLELRTCAERLQDTLDEFGVEGQVVGWIHGPTVTAFKIELQRGVRLNKITNLADDIALSLATSAVRIMSIPGTTLVGVEVPNQTRHNVLLGDVLEDSHGGVAESPLLMGIGKDVEGNCISADLSTMPHLLIGGTTGSGKSVAINSMIMSILMRSTPGEVRMILIDPKRVELTLYNDIPHLYVPVVTDAEKAASALAWATVEMDRRLKLFEKLGVRNIKQYKRLRSDRIIETARIIEDTIDRAKRDGADEAGIQSAVDQILLSEEDALKELPYIVVVIDELADLMMVASKDVETSISRIAAVARAAGIHLVIATQRPSTNVITGVIKANITNRIAFSVASGTDSRVILDSVGAEDLIGHGDLLFSRPEYGKPVRIQGCYVSEKEIAKLVEQLKKQGTPEYHEEIFLTRTGFSVTGGGGFSGDETMSESDPLLWEAADIVVSGGMGSTSTLQRRLSVGYARAGRIMDALESKGIVGPPNGSKPREVLVDVLELESIRAFETSSG